MAVGPKLANGKKRKQAPVEEPVVEEALPQVGLDMHSDEEAEDGVEGSDNDDFDEFPEIDARSDSEGDDEEEEEEEEEEDVIEGEDEDEIEGPEESEEDDDASTDDDLHIFAKSKTVISDITGQPKKVYPEIEPDYDSDSSTEDVRTPTPGFRDAFL